MGLVGYHLGYIGGGGGVMAMLMLGSKPPLLVLMFGLPGRLTRAVVYDARGAFGGGGRQVTASLSKRKGECKRGCVRGQCGGLCWFERVHTGAE